MIKIIMIKRLLFLLFSLCPFIAQAHLGGATIRNPRAITIALQNLHSTLEDNPTSAPLPPQSPEHGSDTIQLLFKKLEEIFCWMRTWLRFFNTTQRKTLSSANGRLSPILDPKADEPCDHSLLQTHDHAAVCTVQITPLPTGNYSLCLAQQFGRGFDLPLAQSMAFILSPEQLAAALSYLNGTAPALTQAPARIVEVDDQEELVPTQKNKKSKITNDTGNGWSTERQNLGGTPTTQKGTLLRNMVIAIALGGITKLMFAPAKDASNPVQDSDGESPVYALD